MNFKNARKASALILALIMIVTVFSACKTVKKGAEGTDKPGTTPQGTVFVPEYLSLPEEITDMRNICFYNNTIYFTSYGVIKSDKPEAEEGSEAEPAEDAGYTADDYEKYGFYDEYGTSIYKMNTDGTGITRLEGYLPMEVPEGKNGSVDLTALCIDKQGNLWAAESGYFYHFDGNDNYVDDGREIHLRKLDSSGAELNKVDISKLADETEYFYISGIAADSEDRIYISSGENKIFVLDNSGNELFTLDTTNWVESIINLSDGRVGILAYEDGRVLKTINAAAKSWGDNIKLPMNAYNLYSGSGNYDLFFNDSSTLMGYSLKTQETTKLVNWINCGINNDDIYSMYVLPDGRILCMIRSFDYSDDYYSSKMELAFITEKPASEVPQKEVLTLATLYTDYETRAAVIKFNKSNDKYRIEVKDYSEYNTENDYNAGLLKLNTEIISGNIPDMLNVGNLPINQYVAKDLLEDLYPFIDADAKLGGRDAVMKDVLAALEVNGKLYQITSSFSITTAIGSSRVVGPEMGWKIDDLMALLEASPEGTKVFSYMTSSNILYYIGCLDMDQYVDWTTGKCSFDSEGFIKLLEFAATFPREYDWENMEYENEITSIQDGKLLMQMVGIYDFREIQMYEAMFGGKITFKGYPCENGIGSAFSLSNGMSMSSKCKNKEGAWEFMRTLLTEEANGRRSWQFPINKASFDKMVQEAMKKEYMTDENGQKVEVSQGSWGWGDLVVDIYATTQEQVDQIMELIAKTDKIMQYDENIMKIVTEESEAFFAGQKSAAETARIIQSRVDIYVNEQR